MLIRFEVFFKEVSVNFEGVREEGLGGGEWIGRESIGIFGREKLCE